MTRITRNGLIVLCLCAGIAVVFSPSLFNGFVWDDLTLILSNPSLHSFSSPSTILLEDFWSGSTAQYDANPVYEHLYRPVVRLAFAVQLALFDHNAAGFHLLSMLLHMSVTAMVFFWLMSRFDQASNVLSVRVSAFVGALVFAFHPSRVQSVAWVSGSTDLWMAFFAMAGLLCFGKKITLLRAAIGGFLIAVAALCKEVAYVIPVVLCFDLWFLKKERRGGVVFLPVFFSFGALVLRQWVIRHSLLSQITVDGTMMERVSASLGHYLSASIWPWHPSAQRAVRVTTCGENSLYDIDAQVAGWLLAFTGVLLAGLSTKHSKLRPWLSDYLWLVFPLLPVVNIFDLGSANLISECCLYFPLLGLCSLVGRLLLLAWPALLSRTLFLGATGIVLLGLSSISSVHAGRFQDNASLWTYQHQLDPTNKLAIKELALHYDDQGLDRKALELMYKGFELSQQRCDREGTLEFALLMLDTKLRSTSSLDQARIYTICQNYESIKSEGELLFEVHGNEVYLALQEQTIKAVLQDISRFQIPRALCFARSLEVKRAERLLETILKTESQNGHVWNLLVSVYARQSKWKKAEHAANKVQELLPYDHAVSRSVKRFRRALNLQHTAVHGEEEKLARDARVQILLDNPEGARRLLDSAIQWNPTSVPLVMAYAQSYVADRRFDFAEQLFQRTLELDPEHQKIWKEAKRRLDAAKVAGQSTTTGSADRQILAN